MTQNISANPANKQELILVRGHPGSGKTTFSQEFVKHGYKHYENDAYFTDANGNYKFDFAFHQVAKDECVNKAIEALKNGSNIVVSNTFTLLKEMDSLVNYAKGHNIPVRVFEMEMSYKNQHDVPADVVEAKKKQFEPFVGAEKVLSSDYKVSEATKPRNKYRP